MKPIIYAQTMADYNRWMNENIYISCASLSDAERKADRGAFFRSIQGTLNHLLLGDRLWLGRFQQQPYQIDSLDQELYADFDELWRERKKTDTRILDWVSELTDQRLAQPLHFTSFANPTRRTCPLWIPVVHFFNHQTHHRGQVTTLLSQCGVDPGVTDLMWLPGLLEPVDRP